MGHFETDDANIALIQHLLDKLVSLDPIKDFEPSDLAPNLEEEKIIVEMYRNLFISLNRMPVTRGTIYELERLKEELIKAEMLLGILETVRQKGLKGSEADYNGAIASIKSHFKTNDFRERYSRSIAQNWLGAGMDSTIDLIKNEIAKIDETRSDIDEQRIGVEKWRDQNNIDIGNSMTKMQDAIKDLELLKKDSRTLLNNITIKKESKIFGDVALWRNIESGIWALASVGMVALLIIFAATLPNEVTGEGPKAYAQIASRFSILTIMSFALFFCSRNYSACRHNATVNSHRKHALETFKFFRDSIEPDDKETRHAMLVEAAKVIYSHSNTGYLKPTAEGGSPNQFVEVVSKIVEKS